MKPINEYVAHEAGYNYAVDREPGIVDVGQAFELFLQRGGLQEEWEAFAQGFEHGERYNKGA